jgi:hypothetical protein
VNTASVAGGAQRNRGTVRTALDESERDQAI